MPDIGDLIHRSRRSAKIVITAPGTPGDFRRSRRSAYKISKCVAGFREPIAPRTSRTVYWLVSLCDMSVLVSIHLVYKSISLVSQLVKSGCQTITQSVCFVSSPAISTPFSDCVWVVRQLVLRFLLLVNQPGLHSDFSG